MKIVKQGFDMRTPEDCVGRRFRCDVCNCVYEIERPEEARRGSGAAAHNLFAACPACKGINCVGSGHRLFTAPASVAEEPTAPAAEEPAS